MDGIVVCAMSHTCFSRIEFGERFVMLRVPSLAPFCAGSVSLRTYVLDQASSTMINQYVTMAVLYRWLARAW
jgi:hypothetical protein